MLKKSFESSIDCHIVEWEVDILRLAELGFPSSKACFLLRSMLCDS